MVGWLGSHFQAWREEHIYKRRKHLVLPNLILQTTAWVDREHAGKEAALRVMASDISRMTFCGLYLELGSFSLQKPYDFIMLK